MEACLIIWFFTDLVNWVRSRVFLMEENHLHSLQRLSEQFQILSGRIQVTQTHLQSWYRFYSRPINYRLKLKINSNASLFTYICWVNKQVSYIIITIFIMSITQRLTCIKQANKTKYSNNFVDKNIYRGSVQNTIATCWPFRAPDHRWK